MISDSEIKCKFVSFIFIKYKSTKKDKEECFKHLYQYTTKLTGWSEFLKIGEDLWIQFC